MKIWWIIAVSALVSCSGTQPTSTGSQSAEPTTTTSAIASVSPAASPEDVSVEARAIVLDLNGRNTPGGIVLDLAADVLFDSGSSTLKPDAQASIQKLAQLTQLIRRDRVLIVGHTDNVGGPRPNQQLSVDRAQAVADALFAANAEVRGRVVVRGAGERQPVADNATAEGRAKNRRVEIEFQGARFRP